jgi:hypothetical protein
MLSGKNHSLEGTEDHSHGKVFAITKSPRCPVNTIKAFLTLFVPRFFHVDMTGGALIGRTPQKFCGLTAIIL